MRIVIIPGFTGYPEEKTFAELEKLLIQDGHSVTKIAWPYYPENLEQYSFTETIKYTRSIIKEWDDSDIALLGFSMGGIIACQLANEFPVKKLGLIVTPYQAGSEDDLAGKYKDWKEIGYRGITSSKFGNLKIPFSFIEDARKYNALDTIDKVSCPILFVVGDKDDRVPEFVTKKLFDKAKEPKVWNKIPSMEHKYQYQPDVLSKVNKIIVSFINS